jgi:hypothetical protein
MGLPRVVRSMEILGHALVDMREAPDAQVVLEIGVVRAVRPDLDSGMEALSDRVSALERSLSGASAFPRPGAPAETSGAGVSAAPAAPPAPPAPDAHATRDGSPEEVGRRPSLGAVRRGLQASGGAPAPGTVEPDGDPPPEPPPATPTSTPTPNPAPSAIDRDGLTEAWGDGILRALPARAKARYASGRFVAVDERGAHFALPNAAHRDQCVEHLPTVEAALAAHFGAPVTLVLEVDDAGPPAGGVADRPPGPRGGGGGSRRSGGVGDTAGTDEMDDIDPADLLDDAPGGAGDHASAAEARLLEAFPGASEVAG